jgi:hypothetical protein
MRFPGTAGGRCLRQYQEVTGSLSADDVQIDQCRGCGVHEIFELAVQRRDLVVERLLTAGQIA